MISRPMPLVSLGSWPEHSGETAVVAVGQKTPPIRRTVLLDQRKVAVQFIPLFSRDQEKLMLRNNAIPHLRDSAHSFTYIIKEDPCSGRAHGLLPLNSAPQALWLRATALRMQTLKPFSISLRPTRSASACRQAGIGGSWCIATATSTLCRPLL